MAEARYRRCEGLQRTSRRELEPLPTTIFGLLDAGIRRLLPVSKPEELVLVVGASRYPVFQAFRQHTGVVADLPATSGVAPLGVEIDEGEGDRTKVSLVSGPNCSTLGVRTAMGGVFLIACATSRTGIVMTTVGVLAA